MTSTCAQLDALVWLPAPAISFHLVSHVCSQCSCVCRVVAPRARWQRRAHHYYCFLLGCYRWMCVHHATALAVSLPGSPSTYIPNVTGLAVGVRLYIFGVHHHVPCGTLFVGKPRCVVGGNVWARGNSLLSTPKLFKYRPTLPHCPTQTFPQVMLRLVLLCRAVLLCCCCCCFGASYTSRISTLTAVDFVVSDSEAGLNSLTSGTEV